MENSSASLIFMLISTEIKGKIRDMQRQRARSRMMQAVPEADVIIRNPTMLISRIMMARDIFNIIITSIKNGLNGTIKSSTMATTASETAL